MDNDAKKIPHPTLAAASGLKVQGQVELKQAVDDSAVMDWKVADDFGMTACGGFRVGKVVAPNAQKVIAYVLIPQRVIDLAAANKCLPLVNVPLLVIPKNVPEAVLKRAVVKRGMPDWFSCGTPPRKTPAKTKNPESEGWEV